MALKPGFTLLEMLVVLVILGISSSVVIGTLPREESGAEPAATDYLLALRRAQLAALHTGTRVQASIRADGAYQITIGPHRGDILESGRSDACSGSITVASPTTYIMNPSGLVFGGTTTFECGESVVDVTVENLEGRFEIAR